jgi:hypothetical protein
MRLDAIGDRQAAPIVGNHGKFIIGSAGTD